LLFVLLPLFITVVMAYSTWKILTWSPILIPSTVPASGWRPTGTSSIAERAGSRQASGRRTGCTCPAPGRGGAC
jgi:hypothetical protein